MSAPRPRHRPPRHLALVGPTASGKSPLALAVARRSGDVELVSLDSMQVYRGMDVGTASPTPAERAAVVHHLIDVVDPWAPWSVAHSQAVARAAVAAIEARGRRALLVGGTGLYVRAVVDGLALAGDGGGDRTALEAEAAAPGGEDHLRAELAAVDPVALARIGPGNVRRLVRAVEVVRATGRPFSAAGPGLEAYGPPALDVALAGVWLPRATLARRIEARVEGMRAGGFADEVARLLADPRGLSHTAAEAIGYRELAAALGGATSLDEAFAVTAARTRRFARRQRVWFRRDPRIAWLTTGGDPVELAPALGALWQAAGPSR